MSGSENVPMRVAAVMVDPDSDAPVLILRAMYDPSVYLPVFVGQVEATAVATFIAGMELPRPMTHDLLVNVLASTGWGLEQVTISRVEDKTFFAELLLTDLDGTPKLIDCRPSDGIALALRAGAKIWVAQAVLDEAGGLAPESDPDTLEHDLEGDLELELPAGVLPDGVGAEDAPSSEPSRPFLGSYGAETDLEDLDPEAFSKYKM